MTRCVVELENCENLHEAAFPERPARVYSIQRRIRHYQNVMAFQHVFSTLTPNGLMYVRVGYQSDDISSQISENTEHVNGLLNEYRETLQPISYWICRAALSQTERLMEMRSAGSGLQPNEVLSLRSAVDTLSNIINHALTSNMRESYFEDLIQTLERISHVVFTTEGRELLTVESQKPLQ